MNKSIDVKMIIFKNNNANLNPIILYCSDRDLIESPFLEDFTCEDGLVECPKDPGAWVWEGTIRVETAQWYGPSWSEGGFYLFPSVGSDEPQYKSEFRRLTAAELISLAMQGVVD